MRLLVLGRSGQVARELERLGNDGHEIRLVGRDEADLSQPEAAADVVRHPIVGRIVEAYEGPTV